LEPRATFYIAEESDFSLEAVARRLRGWDLQPPDRVKQAKNEIRAYWGDWCLRLAWEKGSHCRRAVLESDPEEGENINNCMDCSEMIIEGFHGVAMLWHYTDKWFWRCEEEDATPIPKHLAGWVVQPESHEEGTYVEGTLRCPCGSEQLEFPYPGATHVPEGRPGSQVPCSVELRDGRSSKRWWFGLKAVCVACRKRRILFDSDLHGWNAFSSSPVARARGAKLPRPRRRAWQCLKCGGKAHVGVVHFRFDAPGDFLRKTEGCFRVERRVDAFGWFGMGIKCGGCGHETMEWAGYETA
jgi:hypothetical protein